MVFIRSLIFNIFFFIWSVFISVAGILFLIFLRGKILATLTGRPWAYVSLWGLRIICGIKVEVRGLGNIPQGPCIIASKHQSAWETLFFYKVLKHPVFVLKKELLLIPLYGMYLKNMESIVVDRQAGASALKKMVKDSEIRLAEGRSVIIFPEGTRIEAGKTGEYHPGVSALYARCKAPVIPVALNSRKCWAKNAFTKKPGKIVIEFMPAIEADLRRDQFMSKIEEVIEGKSAELLKEE